ncbi:MAG: hypothetical protein WDO24_02515 [Pseudomonadota bacterium]
MTGAPGPDAGTAAAVQRELDQLTAEIELALSLAGQGEMLELSGIDARVAAACQVAQSLPAPEAEALVDRLGHLVGLLDRLAAELVHQFGNIPKGDCRHAAQGRR